MEKSLVDQINYFYAQKEEMNFAQFKSENKEKNNLNQYLQFYEKCENILLSLENLNIESNISSLQNTIIQTSNKLCDTLNQLKLSRSTNEKISSSILTDESFIQKYKTDSEKVVSLLKENVNKLKKNTYNKEYELLSDVKKANESKKEELRLQQLKNTLAENLKLYKYTIKDKNSKILLIEEKKNSLNDNKLKIEKLKNQFNTNSERMTNEVKNNDICQKEIDSLVNCLNLLTKNKNDDEQEKIIKEEQEKLDKILEENEIKIGDINQKFYEENQKMENIYMKFIGVVTLNYVVNQKIKEINNKNKYNHYLINRINSLKKLADGLGKKTEKVKEDSNNIEKRFLKYQLIAKRIGNY